jgi:outer membrane beta-barrel protein
METRLQRILLAAALALGPGLAWADDRDILGDIASPEVERRHVKERKLDTENFELGVFYGLMSVEDFGSNAVKGLTLAYHATERIFFEAAYGMTDTRETSYELLSGSVALLTEDEREYRYYNLSLGYNLFPAQVYLTENWTFNANAYIIAGAGNTTFAAQDYFTYNLGAGLRLYTTDWLALDISMRGHVFTHELLGREVEVNNLEARMGLSIFF